MCQRCEWSWKFYGKPGSRICGDKFLSTMQICSSGDEENESESSDIEMVIDISISCDEDDQEQVEPRSSLLFVMEASSPNNIGVDDKWMMLMNHLEDFDHTGCKIVNAAVRHDVRSMLEVKRLMDMSGNDIFTEPAVAIYMLLFAFLLYWKWPTIKLMESVSTFTKQQLKNKKVMSIIIRSIYDQFESFRVQNGVLVRSSKGLCSSSRDKDRGNSKKRMHYLLSQLPRWCAISQKLVPVLATRPFRVSDAMTVLDCSKPLRGLSGKKHNYGSIGFIRCLAEAFSTTMCNDETEWLYLRSMSAGLAVRIRSLGLWEYGNASRCRLALAASTQCTTYSLSDMVVFVCLVDKSFL
jgi:hypothetical protein